MAQLVGPDTDRVISWAPIPPGGFVLEVTGEIHVIGSEGKTIITTGAYGFSGRVEPVIDPDGVLAMDTLWDNMVSKPSDAVIGAGGIAIDYDWDTTVGAADVEIGQMDVHGVSGMPDQGSDIFKGQIQHLSFAQAGRGWAAGTPDTYVPTDLKTFRSRKKIGAGKLPAYAMLAFSSPGIDDEETAHTMLGGTTAARDWAILGNLRNVMQDFWRINTGMVEAGAESPYAEMSAAIEDLAAPVLVQPTTDIVLEDTYTVLCQAQWLLEFPDAMVKGIIDGR